MANHYERVIVIGTSCSGKTTFSEQLSKVLSQPHIQLDSLYWGENWEVRPSKEFQARVQEALTLNDRWIADGNYSLVRDMIWSRATVIVWLNYSFTTVFYRALSRTLRRIWSSEEIFSGNKESFYRTFFTKKSILWWVISTFRRRRREYEALQRSGRYDHAEWIEFKTPAQADEFLKSARNET